jgi:hypothetical protein
MPHASSSALSLYQAYDFKGYSLVEGSSTIVADTYTVNGEAVLWAVFKLEEDIRKVIHPEWFTFEPVTIDIHNDESVLVEGLEIYPKVSPLQGKITIPSYMTYEGKELPVISIKGFGTDREGVLNHKVTHIFMEYRTDNKPNQLYTIGINAFRYMDTLTYFDFENCAVTYIGDSAFQGLSQLQYTGSFGKNLEIVGSRAFNKALTVTQNTVVRIPSSVKLIGSYGFGILRIPEGSTLEIGNEINKSKLRFETANPFTQNDGYKFTSVTFYTDLYQNGDPDIATYLGTATNGSITVK